MIYIGHPYSMNKLVELYAYKLEVVYSFHLIFSYKHYHKLGKRNLRNESVPLNDNSPFSFKLIDIKSKLVSILIA